MPGPRHFRLLFATCALLLFVGISAQARSLDLGEPGSVTADATVYAPAFADVGDDHMFAPSIRALFEAGITRGCTGTATRYCPDDTVTRGEMAAFLTRAVDLPAGESVDFTDDDGNIFEDAIERLAASGITRGCNPPANDRFCPDDTVTRGQMAAFLTRARPLEVPPAVPNGVKLERSPGSGGGIGGELTICREMEMSLMVRSVTAGAEGLGMATGWEPSTLVVPVGQVDIATDRWYMPPGAGCETLAMAWDPRANTLTPPLATLQITSPFGYRIHPIIGVRILHQGTDFAAAQGTTVHAAAPGKVVVAETNGDLGRMVEIAHPGGLSTRYAHLSSVAVEVGQEVGSGEIVGRSGCTGMCTGPHLHFETREWDVAVDPMSYLGS